MVERSPGEADHLGANPDPSLVQRFDGYLVALAGLADEVRGGDPAVFENQFAGAAGADAELLFLPAHGEAVVAAFDEKGGDAAVPGGRIGVGEDDEQIRLERVGDEELAAADDPVAGRSLSSRARRQREGVAA